MGGATGRPRRAALVAALTLLVGSCAGCGVSINLGSKTTTRRSVETSSSTSTDQLATLVAQDQTGIVRITSENCSGEDLGTGFLIAPTLVATVEHVVDGATSIELSQSGKQVATGTVIGEDPARDVALVRASQPLSGYVFSFQSSSPALGDRVAALGFPLGLPLTVTQGDISGLDRTVPIDGVSRSQLVQTDAALNPGNSGGPLISEDTGKVVGLVDLQATQAEGIAFAVSEGVGQPLLQAWQDAPQPVSAADCGGELLPQQSQAEAPSTSAPTGANGELPAESPAQMQSDITQLLLDYHQDIVKGDEQDAWNLLSARKQQQYLQQQGYAVWAANQATLAPYLDPSGIQVQILAANPSDGVASVYVSGMGWDKPGASCTQWSGVTWVKYENGSWYYDPGYSTTPQRRAAWQDRIAELLGGSC